MKSTTTKATNGEGNPPLIDRELRKALRAKLDTMQEKATKVEKLYLRAEDRLSRAWRRWEKLKKEYRRLVKRMRELEFELRTGTK
jgi:hypothetical protein